MERHWTCSWNVFARFPSNLTEQNSKTPAQTSLLVFTQDTPKRRLVCESVLSVLVMSYGCFSNKIWLSGTNGCSNPILLVWLNNVELKQGDFCILPQFAAVWIINFSIYISLVDRNGISSSGGEREARNTQVEFRNRASCYWMADKREAFKKEAPWFSPINVQRTGLQGASLAWQGERGSTFLLRLWEEGGPGLALMSEPPSPFSQMMSTLIVLRAGSHRTRSYVTLR